MFHASLYICLPWLRHCLTLEKVTIMNFSTAFPSLKTVTIFFIISSSRESITFLSML